MVSSLALEIKICFATDWLAGLFISFDNIYFGVCMSLSSYIPWLLWLE